MNKELFVSATPHETKVGITEDDQLAEIYLERENEYTLAGSIYKGRVTRVLPGMQSAFVDIGLERDAFLYVSDFMDLEQQDEDLDEAIPAIRPVQGGEGQSRRTAEDSNSAAEGPQAAEASSVEESTFEASSSEAGTAETTRDGGRDFRGRRRRGRGRRENGRASGIDRGGDRGETRSESRSGEFRSESERSERPRGFETRGGSSSRFQRTSSTGRGRDYDYGPPPGYQPIILPGESISKYQRQPTASSPIADPVEEVPAATSITSSFPEDEPIFAGQATEPLHEEHESVSRTEIFEEVCAEESVHSAAVGIAPQVEELRGAAADEDVVEMQSEAAGGPYELAHEADFATALAADAATPEHEAEHFETSQGHIEEQEIEEEEAELAAYGEELGDDDGFEEVEEETRAAGGELISEAVGHTAAASGDSTEIRGTGEVSEAALEAAEREAEEAELEEAQAEAEALLEAEAIGEGAIDASAEVRAAAPEARLMQRTQRRFERGGEFDRRRGGRRGQRRRFRSRENTVVPQISELLKEGQEILVQIAKEPIGKKGARITSHIALPGRFLVFMPTVNHTGVSRKISSEEERQRLKRIIQSERENGGGGFIVRTAAAGASDEELRADIRFLKNLWNEIKSRSESSKSPALIYHDLNVVERVLRDQVSSDFSVIWVDTEQEYERILRFANRFQPALVKRVKLYTKETPLFEQFGLNEEINKALKSKVWLKSGGYIVINQTEALVAIDVNTGKYVGKTTRLEDTIVKTNVDAIREIVRQIRLRDLGGIIIIDFIDMDERRNRQKVMQALEEALRADRAPSKVLQFNDFGLVAITRKRVKQSLERTIGSPCPYCQATGFVKAVNTVCNEIYVEMRKISQHLEHSDVMLRVNPEVAKTLKAGNARLLNEMEELTKKTIIVKSDPSLHQEQFDIH
ncbi:MAG TPA: Rne/Rng family ribonuclease [Terriglobales bacterium]|nr:Rne/Rng family ribonuclease [Terriglobales bacterium]